MGDGRNELYFYNTPQEFSVSEKQHQLMWPSTEKKIHAEVDTNCPH